MFPDAAAVGRFKVAASRGRASTAWWPARATRARTGVEIAVPNAAAPDLWTAVTGAGVTPAGLGARDTLRLEAGLPLHGHELGAGITPLQAGLGWVVAGARTRFVVARRSPPNSAGVSRLLMGIVTEGRRPPRADCAVLIDDHAVGVVTSGNFSPTLGQGIALAFMPPDTEVGTAIWSTCVARPLSGRVAPTPFIPKH